MTDEHGIEPDHGAGTSRLRWSPTASLSRTDEGLIVRSDLGSFLIEGADTAVVVTELLPMLDGTTDAEGVAARLPGYSPHSVTALLETLVAQGVVDVVRDAAQPEPHWRGQEAFLDRLGAVTGLPPGAAGARLRTARVVFLGLEPWGLLAAEHLAVAGVGTLCVLDEGEVSRDDIAMLPGRTDTLVGRERADVLRDELQTCAPWTSLSHETPQLDDSGFLALPAGRWDLVFGTTRADNTPLLLGLARTAHVRGIMSLTAALSGLAGVVGPGVVPSVTACWNCSRERRLAASPDALSARRLDAAMAAGPLPERTPTYPAPAASLLASLVALEAIKLLTRFGPSTLLGSLLTIDLVTLTTRRHAVVRLPWCDVCGGAATAAPPVEVDRFQGSGETNDLSPNRRPSDLRSALGGWVDETTGVIRSLVVHPAEPGAPDLPVTADAVLSRWGDPRVDHGGGAGKGLTASEAMLSAVGEALERYSASTWQHRDLRRAAFDELVGRAPHDNEGPDDKPIDVLDPRSLGLYDDEQYRRAGFPFAPFDPAQPIAWTTGRRVSSGAPVLVPALPVFGNLVVARSEYFCQVTSNGLGTGRSLSEAALVAAFELVERDAFLLTWLAQRSGHQLVPDATLPAEVHEVIRQLGEAGATVHLLELSAGVDVPVVACVTTGDGVHWPSLCMALGAGPDLAVACRKAVLEQGQVGPWLARVLSEERNLPQEPDQVRTVEDHALFYAGPGRAELASFLFDSDHAPALIGDRVGALVNSVEECGLRLAAAGVDLVVCDVTSPDLATSPFRVARALGTFSQSMHFGFALERRGNPRLHVHCNGRINPLPHPLA